jgi:hypothetical protein
MVQGGQGDMQGGPRSGEPKTQRTNANGNKEQTFVED